MATTAREKVYEHDGHLWKALPGASSTFEELLAAKATFLEIHRDANWNPWVLEDRAAELEDALRISNEWTRAEPGFRYMTDEELEAELEKGSEEVRARFAAQEARCERDRVRYDPEREAARLSLLEQQSCLDRDRYELEEYQTGRRFPAMDRTKRDAKVQDLEAQIPRREATIARLSEQVGDPEDVVDERGQLPRDRRETMLVYYGIDRRHTVQDLRKRLPELRAALKESSDRAEKSKLRFEVQMAEGKMADLLAVPPLTADEMCSECATPASKHGWSTPPYDGPCPAWPGWAARIREAWKILEQAAARAKPPEPEPPKPQPLAVVPSGLPIGEIAKRLAELEAEFPTAIVKRGRANRWEVWATE